MTKFTQNYQSAFLNHSLFTLKNVIIFLLFLQIPITGKSAINYAFSASAGAFTANAAPTVLHAAGVDDAFFVGAPIGFTFNYGGCTTTPYTTVNVSSNGVLSLGNGLTGTVANNLLTTTTQGPLIAPLWDDLAVGTGGSVNYKTTGVAGSRIFTVEWLNMKWGWSSTIAISFQAKLYETSGKIEFIYRQEAGGTSSPSASIGINGAAAGDFYSLNGTGASPVAVYGTETLNLSSKPATGQVYSWTLPGTMTYTSSTVTQASTANVYQASTNQEIIAVPITVTGGCTPFSLTQMIINMTGTTSITDVTNIDVYYTGNTNAYSASTLFGSIAPAVGSLTVNGTQLLQNGINYFWIVYDVAAGAVVGDLLDAQCTQITMNGGIGNKIPSITNPAGTRPIITVPGSFSKWNQLSWMKGVVEATGGGIIWGGRTTNTYSSGGSDAYFMKTSNDLATIAWTRATGTATSDEQLEDIVQTADGIVGVGWSNMAGGAAGYNIFVTKINNSGVVLWTRTIGTAGTDYGYGICLTSDGNIAICGIVNTDDGYFAKINNSTGAIIAEKTINYPSQTVYLNDIIQTIDGGYLMVGKTAADFYMIKLTSAYALDWGRSWDGGSTDALNFVLENGANDYTIGGYSYSYGAGSSDGYIMRFTWSGAAPTVTWAKAVGSAEYNTFNDGEKTSDGGYIMTGITTRLGDPLNDEAFMAKINSAGTNVFIKSIGTTTVSEDEEGYDVFPMSDGSFVTAGLHNDAVGDNGYLVKMSSDAFNCSIVQDNGGITNLAPPSFTTNGTVSAPSGFTTATPSVTVNTGGVITGGCATLPIELIEFNVTCFNNTTTELYWSTASETNNDYFTIERSIDGKKFNEIGSVKGTGNSNIIQNYKFSDDSRISKITYYRLKQTDFDGKFEYSDLKVSNCISDNEFNIYPNPFANSLEIKFEKETKTDFNIEIKNYLGQIILSKIIPEHSFIYEFEIDKNMPNGVYFIQIFNKEESHIKKVIKL